MTEAARLIRDGRLAEAAALCAPAPDAATAALAALIAFHERRFDEAREGLRAAAAAFPDDAAIITALAETDWALDGAEASLPRFDAARALLPDSFGLALRRGLALAAAGHRTEAEAAIRAAAALVPETLTRPNPATLNPATLNPAAPNPTAPNPTAPNPTADAALGHLLAEMTADPVNAGTPFGAGACLRATPTPAVPALAAAFPGPVGDLIRALDPGDAETPARLGRLLRAAGLIDPALAALREAVLRAPDRPASRMAFGAALRGRGDVAGAVREIGEAVRLDPASAPAWTALGDALQLLDRIEAVACFRNALSLDERNPALFVRLGDAFQKHGAEANARQAYADAAAFAWWARGNPPPIAPMPGRPRVALLSAPGGANTPTDFIIDRNRCHVEVIRILDGVDYPADTIAAGFDLVFNAVCDPDRAAAALGTAHRLVGAMGLPALNPPAAILETGRDRMATRLDGIQGLTVPPTRRLATTVLRQPDQAAALLDAIGFPLLIRPVGEHGGLNLFKAEGPADVARYLDAGPDHDIYLTRYCDYRSADGYFRKFRVIFVDGEIFPYHLAVGGDWLIHYFRTAMHEVEAFRREEERFIEDGAGLLSPARTAALRAIGERVGLDYFGLDCAVDPTGAVLMFETNAAMLVRHADSPEIFAYKRFAADRIRRAVGAMIERRATPAP